MNWFIEHWPAIVAAIGSITSAISSLTNKKTINKMNGL